MSYNFYDFQNAIQQRNDYVEDQLRDGSPVIGISCPDGIVLFTLRGSQRKLFEVYDRIAYGAMGRQSDVESIRIAAIDTAHREGFQRSEDDVCLSRLVGFGISPAVKQVYNDQRAVPLTIRALFAELHDNAADDVFCTLNYDGEYRISKGSAVITGVRSADDSAKELLKDASPSSRDEAIKLAAKVWAHAYTAMRHARKPGGDVDDSGVRLTPDAAFKGALDKGLILEAALLTRSKSKTSRFECCTPEVVSAAVAGLDLG
jgi:proteasome alpha subunit